MRTSYTAPSLVEHGTIAELTAQTLDSSRVDFFVDANGNPTASPIPGINDTSTGSLDLCLTPHSGPDVGSCVNPR
jgi:hypothetical protein